MGAENMDMDVFFLPFDCAPAYTLEEPRGGDEGGGGKGARVHFNALRVVVERPPAVYVLHAGDFAMLRPPSNEETPYIGRVVDFFRDAAAPRGASYVRVQWFYHSSDYLEKLPRCPAEDELLETPHFNDVDVQSVVGRCTVTPYEEYARLTRLDTNITAAPVYDVDAFAEGTPDNHEKAASDSDSDCSMFADNYSSASTRYFCREYYDACLDATAVAEFEDPTADPVAEVRDAMRGDDAHDPDAHVESQSESDVESSDNDFSSSRKRSRRGAAKNPQDKRPRPTSIAVRANEAAVQFTLPNIDLREALPCREAEKDAVRTFLKNAIESSHNRSHGSGRCLYISGVPGTGKTATVREVVASLRACIVDGTIAPFEVVEINGMALSDPGCIYSELYAAVVGKRGVPPSRAQQLLGERFVSADERLSRGVSASNVREQGKCVILLLDEMDILVSRSQQILHTVLEWSARPHSRLAVIGIANTMDLPERLLAKSKSRMGDNRLVYAPYNKDQLLEILGLRLRDFPLEFEHNAKVLVASKIASLSGDVRRALELCRRATTVATASKPPSPSVKISHVNDAVGEMTGGARLKVVALSPLNDRLVLIATLLLSRSVGSFDVDFCTSLRAVYQKCREISREHKECFPWGEPSTEELDTAVSRLASGRIILVERDARPFASRIVINMSPDDVVYALDDDELAMAELQYDTKPRSRART